MKKLITLLVPLFLFPLVSSSVHAGIIDFTSDDWSGVGQNSVSEFIFDGIKLSSVDENLTFNDPDGASGCGKGDTSQTNLAATTGLACIGDGIGISNDEITQGGSQILTVSFLNGPVDILDIHLLDLFAGEQSGEIAIINGISVYADPLAIVSFTNDGGYWESGLQFYGVESLTFSGNLDTFSDYSLARIAYKVPEPTVIALFTVGLLGLGFARRRKHS
jgi:hypothetical protein